MMTTKTYRLVTVNTAPEWAKLIVGRIIQGVKDTYSVDYVSNAESMCSFEHFGPVELG